MSKNSKTLWLLILAIITFGIPPELFSQVAGIPPGGAVYGYVRLSNGDTLQGLVKWRVKYVENNLAEITFIAKNGNSRIFNAAEISGFGHYAGGKVQNLNTPESPENENYESVLSLKNGIPVFMYRFLDGRIKIFQHRSIQKMSSGFDKKSSKIDGIYFSFTPADGLSIGPSYKTSNMIIEGRSVYSSYLVTKDKGKLLEVDKKNYDQLFPVLYGDCSKIGQEIEKNPDLAKFKYFMILTEVYNQICKESSGSN
jgi:hypothetical protein